MLFMISSGHTNIFTNNCNTTDPIAARHMLLVVLTAFEKIFLYIVCIESLKTNNMTFAPSKDSDQPGHPPSLTSLSCPREKKKKKKKIPALLDTH